MQRSFHNHWRLHKWMLLIMIARSTIQKTDADSKWIDNHILMCHYKKLHPPLIGGNNARSYEVVFDPSAVQQLLKTFILLPKSIPVILQLLLVPIMIGVGVEQVDECIPPMFREALYITVTIRYDGITCSSEDLVLVGSLLSVLPALFKACLEDGWKWWNF